MSVGSPRHSGDGRRYPRRRQIRGFCGRAASLLGSSGPAVTKACQYTLAVSAYPRATTSQSNGASRLKIGNWANSTNALYGYGLNRRNGADILQAGGQRRKNGQRRSGKLGAAASLHSELPGANAYDRRSVPRRDRCLPVPSSTRKYWRQMACFVRTFAISAHWVQHAANRARRSKCNSIKGAPRRASRKY